MKRDEILVPSKGPVAFPKIEISSEMWESIQQAEKEILSGQYRTWDDFQKELLK